MLAAKGYSHFDLFFLYFSVRKARSSPLLFSFVFTSLICRRCPLCVQCSFFEEWRIPEKILVPKTKLDGAGVFYPFFLPVFLFLFRPSDADKL